MLEIYLVIVVMCFAAMCAVLLLITIYLRVELEKIRNIEPGEVFKMGIIESGLHHREQYILRMAHRVAKIMLLVFSSITITIAIALLRYEIYGSLTSGIGG